MSLSEDARELSEASIIEVSDHSTCCPFCGGFVIGYGWDSKPSTTVECQGYDHYHNCPWLSLPRIVAALEAAERVVTGWRVFNTTDPDGALIEIPHPLYDALVAALRTTPSGEG